MLILPVEQCRQRTLPCHQKFSHAESLTRISLIEIKSFSDVVSGLFNCSPGKNSVMDHSVPTITGKDYLTLLRPSLREYRPVAHSNSKKGRASAGPVQRLPMEGFCMPNEKDHSLATTGCSPLKFRACAEFMKMRQLDS
jgi:hypothetical protein